jgi:triosephosphate isomerase
MRKQIAAGNWKMNLNKEQALSLTSEIDGMSKDELQNDAILILCVPFIHAGTVSNLITNKSKVFLGVQNAHQESKGAFTGETSVDMLADYGVKYVILGHSERREYFKESNELLAQKVDTVLNSELLPIFCCGEVLEERKSGKQNDVVKKQVEESLFHLDKDQVKKVVIAYEPVWAIGTGETASPEQAQEMHAHIRSLLTDKYGQDVANEISILYGGSMKPGNAKELIAQADVDGGLIGGASLKSRDFIDIAKSF